MTPSPEPDVSDLRARFDAAGQGHVFAFWDELSRERRASFAKQLSAVDLARVAELAALVREPPRIAGDVRFEPPDVFPVERGPAERRRAREAIELGRAELAAGRVAYLLVAGGQGSRLGFEGPKGMFPVGPVTGRTLFELFGRKLVAAREEHGADPLWFVMTSGANDAATRAYFAEQRWFGLGEGNVRFFSQAENPALDDEGRIVLAGKDALFLAPDGHGGVLAALAASGGLALAAERGVERLSYFQVDNPLAEPADPLFVGLHALEGAQMSTKVVAKREPGEKVGVLGLVDGALSCIEYSDLPAELRERRTGSGELAYRAGNIAVHVIDRGFVERLTRGELRLPWHLARKALPSVDERGRRAERPGVKFERFVFDALRFTDRSVVLEVDRSEEFAPVKNKEGQDSPHTARAAQCARYASWVRAAGLELPPPDADGLHPVEVDPVLARDEDAFVERAGLPAVSAEGHFYS